MRTLKRSFVGLCLVLIATAEASSPLASSVIEPIARGVNQFASALLQPLVKSERANLVLSPVCTDIGLAMAAFGAGGSTRNQLQGALFLQSLDTQVAEGYRDLIDNLNGTQYLQLLNRIFINENFSVKPTYYQLLKDYFRSGVDRVNLQNPKEAANTINRSLQDVAKNQPVQAKDLISSSDLDEKPDLVLASLMYLKSEWKYKFNPAETQQRPFWTDKSNTKSVPTMRIVASYRHGYIVGKNPAEFVILPYKGDELCMLILLPKDIDGLAQLEQDLTSTNISDILKAGSDDLVELYLPKFKLQRKLKLNAALSDMGVTDMFSPNADFNGITDGKLKVNRVVHLTGVEVDEDGSSVISANVDFLKLTDAGKPLTVEINRPFYYAIIKPIKEPNNNSNNVILFNGHVIEPKI